MKSQRKSKWIGPFLVVVSFASLALIGAAGCDQESSSGGPLDETAIAAGGEDPGGALGAGPFATLTADQIDARVKLTAEQRPAIESALNEVRASRQDRAARWGRGGRRGRPFAEKAIAGPAAGEPPALVFLEEASKTLTPDQFVGLARLLKEQRDSWTAQHQAARGAGRHGRNGPGHREGGAGGQGLGPAFGLLGDRAAEYLDLTDAQRTQIKGILDGRADELRGIHDQIASGAITREQARDRTHTIRTEMRDQMKGILTAEQWERAEASRSKRVSEQIDARTARMDDQLDRRAAFLDRVLELTPAQSSSVHELLKGSMTARKEILNGVKAGTVEPEDAAPRVLELERGVADQIGVLLTPVQQVRWGALRDLLPPGERGRGF